MDDLKKAFGETEHEMKARIDKLGREYSTLRTGRANPQMIEGVKVAYYGSLVPIKQVAQVGVPEARILEIRPWDPGVLEEIDKALQKADLGIPPQNDGKVVRLNMPTMTEDRRKDMVKIVKRMGEEAKVAIRGFRRDYLDKVKKAEKSKDIPEDEVKRQEGIVQKATDAYVAKVDEAMSGKEKEITTV